MLSANSAKPLSRTPDLQLPWNQEFCAWIGPRRNGNAFMLELYLVKGNSKAKVRAPVLQRNQDSCRSVCWFRVLNYLDIVIAMAEAGDLVRARTAPADPGAPASMKSGPTLFEWRPQPNDRPLPCAICCLGPDFTAIVLSVARFTYAGPTKEPECFAAFACCFSSPPYLLAPCQ